MTETTETTALPVSAYAALVAPVAETYKEVKSLRARYVSATDVDEALADIIDSEPSDTEWGQAIHKLDQARKAIAILEPKINEWAREKAVEQRAGDFDEQTERANYNDAQKRLKDIISATVTVLEQMGEFDEDGEPTTQQAAELRKMEADLPSRINKPGGGGGSTNSGGGDSEAAAIREWAKRNGMEVSQRGRISADVRDAYRAAKGENAAPAESADSEG